ncbi:XkdX family protein [Fructobacillus sp. W13]|uniref:XkdX family protein n=1 Tax=Fructobacillus apis TaxID=2935017 RepID=A0ABT0ZPI0_9LACO|nr:XkdX family protein [Fructobacillus apis]MCO0831905.1 XkdX family protein [Fructobacillus apis]
MFDALKDWFKAGYFTEKDVAMFVPSEIREGQYFEITGKEYTKEV